MKVLSPFGPKIAIIKIPKSIVNKINREVDKILDSKKRLRKSDYSNKLVGQVKQEIRLDSKFIQKNLLKFVGINVKKYIKKCTKKDTKKISLRNLWVVRQFKNEYNPIHFHSGNISGVGYLKIPKNMPFPIGLLNLTMLPLLSLITTASAKTASGRLTGHPHRAYI